jgi:hypothetical protein
MDIDETGGDIQTGSDTDTNPMEGTFLIDEGDWYDGYKYESAHDPEDNNGLHIVGGSGWVVFGPEGLTFWVKTEDEAKLWTTRLNIAWKEGRKNVLNMMEQISRHVHKGEYARQRAQWLARQAEKSVSGES